MGDGKGQRGTQDRRAVRGLAALALVAFVLVGVWAWKRVEQPAEQPTREQREEGRPPESPSPGSGGPSAAGGAAGEVWNPFRFRAGQYFKYSVTLSDQGKKQTGWFSLELKPAGGDQVEAIWQGEFQGQKFSLRQSGTTEQVTNPAGVLVAAAMSGGPAAMPLLTAAGATVFVPWYPLAFAGQVLKVGAGWQVTEPTGERFSVMVVSRCEEAGIQGYLVRLDSETREEKGRMEACVAPRYPLALSTRAWRGGELEYEAVLREQRGF